MRSHQNKSKSPPIEEDEEESLISLLDNFLNPDLSQAEITQNAFSIQLNLAKLLSSFHFRRSRNLLKNVKKKKQCNNDSDNDDDGEYKGESQTKRRKKNEIFGQKSQNEFAEKAIFIVNYYLDPSNNHDENEEVSQNILTIMNFIPSLLQKIDSVDQAYIQKLTDQINTDSTSLFALQLPLLHSISEIMHGPQLSNLLQEKIKSYIRPDLSISSSLLNICIFNFGYQKNYQFQWAEIARKVFLSSNRQQLMNSSLMLKSKRTCSNELCNMLCRVIRDQSEKCNELDFFLILILSSINSITTNKLLKHFTKYNKLNELTIKNCPIRIVPMNNIIDALYTISSSKNLIDKTQIIANLSRIISEIFICSENPEILTFALFNEDENKVLLESTIEAIIISSQEAHQLFISTFDSIGVLYTVSKQVSHQLIKPILKLSCVFTQLFDSIVIYLKKLVNHPSGMMSAIDSLCSLLEDLSKQQQNQQQLSSQETENDTKKKKKQKKKAQNQTKSFNFEDQSNCTEMQLEVLKVIENIVSTSPYLRSLVFRKLSEKVPFLSERSKIETKRIATEYKEETLNPDLFIDLITDQFDQSSEDSITNFVFAKDYPSSLLQLLISLGDDPSDYFYFIEYRDSDFNYGFHFSLQLALRADVYSILAPFDDDAFIAFSEYLKTIDFIATDEERKIISEWCSLRLDDSFVRRVIVEENTDDSLLLYTVLRQLSTYSTSTLMSDKELILALRNLFSSTAESDFGVTKIPLKKHILKNKVLPRDAFIDTINQFREELTFQIAETASIDEEGFANFDPSFFIDEMKHVIEENAITRRHCQSFFDIFDKFLPVSSDSSSKLFDLLVTLKFDDTKIFSIIVDLILSKSPHEDAFIVSNLLLSCIKGENDSVYVNKEPFKNAVMIRIAKFISSFSFSEFNDEEFGQLIELLCNLMSFGKLNQNICQAIFKSVNFVIKALSDNLVNDFEKKSEDFLKFKKICDNWISCSKQKIGIRRCGVCKAFLQMTESQINRMKRNKNDDDDEEDEDEIENANRMRDYTEEFDSLLELLQKEDNNNDDDENINIDELILKDNIDGDDLKNKKKKKKKKMLKRLPLFVPRKWRSQSKWIDEGLKEVTDSDDNFADLEDFVVENSPQQSDYDNEEEDSNS